MLLAHHNLRYRFKPQLRLAAANSGTSSCSLISFCSLSLFRIQLHYLFCISKMVWTLEQASIARMRAAL